MSSELNAAVRRESPKTDGTNASNVRRFTSDNAVSKSNAVPSTWQGRYVSLTNESVTAGQNVRYLFSFVSTAVVDTAVAAADDGAPNTALGAFLRAGEVATRLKIPGPLQGKTCFFVRRAEAGTPPVTMELVEL